MIAAVTCVRDDADVLAASVGYLLAQGVEALYVHDDCGPDDPTRGVLEALERSGARLRVVRELSDYLRQVAWMNELVVMAAADGAEWVVPFDADEFWLARDGTLGDALRSLPPDVSVARATLWHHQGRDWKVTPAEPLPKVAFRPLPGAFLGIGNHSVSVPGEVADGLLEVRHLQYRSFEHFRRKARASYERLEPELLDAGVASHHSRLRDATPEEYVAAWLALSAREVVYDPIPERGGAPPA